uniref:Uncharacterized protein n=1 Tax=Arion vulgaris TaxID=1028688 RepID=A0A0B7AM38_9EUPU
MRKFAALDIMHFVKTTLDAVMQSTIMNCFNKVDFHWAITDDIMPKNEDVAMAEE